jgi:hypothetical protein
MLKIQEELVNYVNGQTHWVIYFQQLNKYPLSPEQYELINKQIQESIEKFNLEKSEIPINL